MTPFFWFILSHFLYTQCQTYTKQVTLTPQNPQQQGARAIILETEEVTATTSSWNIISLDKIGFHMQVSLEPVIWGFHPSKTSTISVTIDSNTPMPTESKLILSASVNNKYVTSIIQLNNVWWNKIAPECDDDTGTRGNYLTGDVAAKVSENNTDSRLYKATNYQKVNFGESNTNLEISFPITLVYTNEPQYNEMFVTFLSSGWGDFDQWCRFEQFDLNMGMDLYIALNNVGEALNITSITVKYEHTGTGAPSTPPTKSPTLTPTRTPTLNPSNMPTTFQPTNIPTIIPTYYPSNIPTTTPTGNPSVNPTNNPTEIPTINPTINPSVNPTFNPTMVPTMLTTDPTAYPTLFTDKPTVNPTINPTQFPTNPPTRAQGEISDQTTGSQSVTSNEDGDDTLSQNNGILGNNLMFYGVIAIVVLLIVLTCLICIYMYVNKKKRKSFLGDSVQMQKITSVSAQNETDVNDKCAPNSSEEIRNNNKENVLQSIANSMQTPITPMETDTGNRVLKDENTNTEESEEDEELDEMYEGNLNAPKQTIGGDENVTNGYSDSSDSLQPQTTTSGNTRI